MTKAVEGFYVSQTVDVGETILRQVYGEVRIKNGVLQQNVFIEKVGHGWGRHSCTSEWRDVPKIEDDRE